MSYPEPQWWGVHFMLNEGESSMTEKLHPDQERAAAALTIAGEQDMERDDADLHRALAEHAKVDDVLRFFRFDHLPQRLKVGSRPFADLALHIVLHCPRCPQRTIGLNKLLEAKDASVRTFVT